MVLEMHCLALRSVYAAQLANLMQVYLNEYEKRFAIINTLIISLPVRMMNCTRERVISLHVWSGEDRVCLAGLHIFAAHSFFATALISLIIVQRSGRLFSKERAEYGKGLLLTWQKRMKNIE